MEMKRSSKFTALFKTCLFLVLAAMSFNVYAMYLGNPNRPDTVWQPGHYDDGCWVEGHYLKFLTPPTCDNVSWVDGHYDRHGDWIPAHYRVMRYHVVNPGPDSAYPGFAM